MSEPISSDQIRAAENKANPSTGGDIFEGVHEADEDKLLKEVENLPKNLAENFESLLDVKNKKSPMASFMDGLKTSISSVFNKDNGKEDTTNENFEKLTSALGGNVNVAAKLKPTTTDILKLGKDSLGYLLLYWKLDEISNFVNPTKKKDKQEGEGGSGGFFGGLLKGLGGAFKALAGGVGAILAIAGAIAVFALAMVLFTQMDFVKALAGLGLFALFIYGMYSVSKFIQTSGAEKDFIGLARASLYLSAGLAAFSIALWITSSIVSGQNFLGMVINLAAAVIGVGLFLGFIAGFGFVARAANKEQKNFVELAKASVFLSLGLATFAISLWIVSAIMSAQPISIFGLTIPGMNVGYAMGGLVLFGAFLLGFAIISRIAGANNSSFQSLAKASTTLSFGLVAFSTALWITSAIMTAQPFSVFGFTIPGINIAAAMNGLVLFGGFILGAGILSALANKFAPNFKQFAITVLLLTASLAAFALTLGFISLLKPTAIMQGVKVLVMMGLFIAGMIGLAALSNLVPKTVWINFAITVGLMLLSLFAFTSILQMIDKLSENIFLKGIAALGLMGIFLIAAAGLGAIFLIPVVGAALGVGLVLLTGASLLMFISFKALSTAVTYAGSLTPEIIKNAANNTLALIEVVLKASLLGLATIPALLTVGFLSLFAGKFATAIGHISTATNQLAVLSNTDKAVTNMKNVETIIYAFAELGLKTAVKLILAIPAIMMLGVVSSILSLTISAITSLAKVEIQKDIIDRNLESISSVLQSVTEMKTPNPIKAALIKSAVLPLVSMMSALTGLIRDLQGIDENQIVAAKAGIAKIGTLIASDEEWTFNDLLKKIDGVGKKQVQAAQAMNAISGTIVTLASNLDVFAVEPNKLQMAQAGIQGLGNSILYLNSYVLQNISKLPKDISTRMENLSSVTKTIKNNILPNMTDWIVPATETITAFRKSADELSKVKNPSKTFDSINKSVEKFNTAKLTAVGDTLTIIKNNVDFQNKLDPLIEVANKAKDFERIANAFDRIGKSSVIASRNTGIFNNLGNASGGSVVGDQSTKTTTIGNNQISNTAKDLTYNALQNITMLLEDWKKQNLKKEEKTASIGKEENQSGGFFGGLAEGAGNLWDSIFGGGGKKK